jgi:ATP-binding cassette subfamily B (MDR/TAP) protein 1
MFLCIRSHPSLPTTYPAISFAFSWKLSLLSFFVVMPIGAFCGYHRLRYENSFAKLYEAVFAESSQWAAESIAAVRTVSSLTLEKTICQRYQLLLDRHVSEATKKGRYTSVVFALSDSLSMACTALIFWVGGRWLVSGEVSALGFFVVFMAILAGADGTGQLLSLAPHATQAAVASNRILLARETKISTQDMTQPPEEAPSKSERDDEGERGVAIELRDVHFKYPTRDVWVLRGVSLRIDRGQFVALVGASGR